MHRAECTKKSKNRKVLHSQLEGVFSMTTQENFRRADRLSVFRVPGSGPCPCSSYLGVQYTVCLSLPVGSAFFDFLVHSALCTYCTSECTYCTSECTYCTSECTCECTRDRTGARTDFACARARKTASHFASGIVHGWSLRGVGV